MGWEMNMLRLEDAFGELENRFKPVVAFWINAQPEKDKLQSGSPGLNTEATVGYCHLAGGSIDFGFTGLAKATDNDETQ